MTDRLREAAQAAVDLIESDIGIGGYTEVALATLRAALAEESRHVSELLMNDGNYRRAALAEEEAAHVLGENTSSERVAETAEREHVEPVAWMRWDDEEECYDVRRAPPPQEAIDHLAKRGRPAWRPLYAHPPRREWQNLTEKEIKAMYDDCDADTGHAFVFAFSRAIEAALKEKNDD